MTDSPYLQRASEMDALAVSVATTLLQSLTLIHGGALIAIPAFAEQFKVILQSPNLICMVIFFAVGLASAIFAGIFAFFALGQRSDENLELWKAATSGIAFDSNPKIQQHLRRYRRWRLIGIGLILLSSLSLLLATGTGVWIINVMPVPPS